MRAAITAKLAVGRPLKDHFLPCGCEKCDGHKQREGLSDDQGEAITCVKITSLGRVSARARACVCFRHNADLRSVGSRTGNLHAGCYMPEATRLSKYPGRTPANASSNPNPTCPLRLAQLQKTWLPNTRSTSSCRLRAYVTGWYLGPPVLLLPPSGDDRPGFPVPLCRHFRKRLQPFFGCFEHRCVKCTCVPDRTLAGAPIRAL